MHQWLLVDYCNYLLQFHTLLATYGEGFTVERTTLERLATGTVGLPWTHVSRCESCVQKVNGQCMQKMYYMHRFAKNTMQENEYTLLCLDYQSPGAH